MRLLHTSDWHLGQLLYGHDRNEEQQSMLNQIKMIVASCQPDALLVSGDIFHTSTPSASVQQTLVEYLVEFHKACPDMTIVVTAGNHDSASRHEIFHTPWQALNVYSIGNYNSESINRHIIELPGKGFIIAVPYINERSMPKDLFIQLQSMVEERNSDSLPVVMMAHTTLSGCDFSGHDNATERTVGGIDSCPLEQMGSYYDYLALGHIHKAQFVHGGNGRVRYCGTPLPISFDETSEHSVSLVEIESHGTTPKVETLPIDNPRPLVTIPDKGFLPWESIIQQIKEFPNDIPAYLKLNVEVENFLKANANYEALELLKNKKARLCQINAHRTIVQKKEHQGMTISELQQESPLSLLHRYAADKGFTIDEELENMFKSVLNND